MTEEERKIKKEQLLELLFIQYVSALVNSGMQQLGKIMNPMTGKTEKNLEAVQATIELLSMLKEKTKNNLSGNEANVLADGLANLQLNFADEAKRSERKTEKK
jgi:hypothetical protein